MRNSKNNIYSKHLFRANANNGVWCCFLLPLALLDSFGSQESVSDLKEMTFLISCVLALISLHLACRIIYIPKSEGQGLWHYFLQVTISDLFERSSSVQTRLRRKLQAAEERTERNTNSVEPVSAIPLIVAMCITISILLLLLQIEIGLAVYLYGAVSVYAYVQCLLKLFQVFPGTFTFGEGCIVVQALVLFIFEAPCSLIIGTHDLSTIGGSFGVIGISGLMSCMSLIGVPMFPGLHWTSQIFLYIAIGIVILFGITLPYLCFTLKREPITWTLELIFSNNRTSILTAIWTLLTGASVLVVLNQGNTKATTRTRKIFHLIMVIAYSSGIILDPDFTFLGSIVAFCVLILLESFRYYKIPPLDAILTNSFRGFLDEKDQGKLILTHIYLLVGCSLPLWLAHDFVSVPVVKLLSGVLSIGIGDSAASIIGSKVGRLKFPETQKSVEGTLASIASQILFIWMLNVQEIITVTSWPQYYLPVILVSLVEALTNQVDNLILPLVLYYLL